jgi:parallel beta-helix repeat protein
MVMQGNYAAFMSYARFNDQHDDGQLSEFRERLAAEVRAQTGQTFTIFQDRNDIAWGQNWKQRIDETLDTVPLLLIIITPSLFNSPACRDEFTKFLERERTLGRQDLILPVYYISAREMDDSALREADEMARVLASRQLADWRELRFEPLTSPLVRKAVAHLASRLRDTFWQSPVSPTVRSAKNMKTEPPTGAIEQASSADKITAKTEPPTYVVDVFPGRGDFTTVSAAVAAAKPGDRILVRPGLYEEALVLDKPLEILGDGPVSDIEIRAYEGHALMFQTSIGRVANLTLRQAGGAGKYHGVNITQGRLDLEGCDISSQALSCIAIKDGADPRLRRNKIHSSKQGGVYVFDNGLGTLEDNDITGNGYSGVGITTGGNPTLRRNQIHDNKQNGAIVYNNGLGTLEDNDITGNGFSGVEITSGGNLILRRNQINRNSAWALNIHEEGRCLAEDNDLTGNAEGAWRIVADRGGTVTSARNKELPATARLCIRPARTTHLWRLAARQPGRAFGLALAVRPAGLAEVSRVNGAPQARPAQRDAKHR